MSINDHAPALRILSGESTASDRQWLRMLDETFKPISIEQLSRMTIDLEAARDILGLIALTERTEHPQ